MNADLFCKIGYSHNFCQDYAIYDRNGLAISDGCSSAPIADVGSKLLCLSSIKNLNKLSSEEEILSYIENVKKDVSQSIDLYNLPADCFCATLLNLVEQQDRFVTFIMGDGSIVAKSDDKIMIVDYNFANSVPYYLRYSLDESLNQQYYDNHGKSLTITKTLIDSITGEIIESSIDDSQIITNNNNYFINEFPFSEWHTVSLFSDGVKSFTKEYKNQIPYIPIIRDLMDYKSYNGKFVVRRSRKVIQNLENEKVNNFDDFTIATLSLKEF